MELRPLKSNVGASASKRALALDGASSYNLTSLCAAG
jgi:hypothetical protein